ncbi:MAG: hypothetical protein U0736_14480 [Gemmataceae bacterium]
MAKKTAQPAPATKADAPKKAGKRTRWLDPKSNHPLLKEHAEKMQSYLTAVADGVVEDHELKTQEERVAALMADLEPRLDDETHELVTQLLIEITVYDMLQVMQTIQQTRPATRLRL